MDRQAVLQGVAQTLSSPVSTPSPAFFSLVEAWAGRPEFNRVDFEKQVHIQPADSSGSQFQATYTATQVLLEWYI